ncbi:MAG: S1 RNA-binding domain-containing protein [Candidatus Margulisbacteria bacterium]|nr:S1 RNA-binding domain-containing protein [Candidatus Margulisiibacteriota bacterium]
MISIENEENILEKDSIVDGVVTGVTSFGAFVKLPGNNEGLVHISEIANEYVTDINKHVALNDNVKVKVLGKNPKGKYDLSMKKASPPKEHVETEISEENRIATMDRRKAKKLAETGELNPFESKMLNFLKKSEEKQIDLKRNIQTKQGVKKKKKLKK